jgi:hypothetical protein
VNRPLLRLLPNIATPERFSYLESSEDRTFHGTFSIVTMLIAKKQQLGKLLRK